MARTSSFGPKIETSAPKPNAAVVTSGPILKPIAAASARKSTPQSAERTALTSRNSGLFDSAEKAAREYSAVQGRPAATLASASAPSPRKESGTASAETKAGAASARAPISAKTASAPPSMILTSPERSRQPTSASAEAAPIATAAPTPTSGDNIQNRAKGPRPRLASKKVCILAVPQAEYAMLTSLTMR